MLSTVVTKGSAPSVYLYPNPSSNRLGSGYQWDAAAIGVRESRFIATAKERDGGEGRGAFQIDLRQNRGVTEGQAMDLKWAANWAARTLSSRQNQIATAVPGLSDYMALWTMVASWNTGAQGQINR